MRANSRTSLSLSLSEEGEADIEHAEEEPMTVPNLPPERLRRKRRRMVRARQQVEGPWEQREEEGGGEGERRRVEGRRGGGGGGRERREGEGRFPQLFDRLMEEREENERRREENREGFRVPNEDDSPC